jgi:cell division protein ZipA
LASELRWFLAGFSALLLIGIWWWGVRRSRHAPGDAHLRKTNSGPPVMGPSIRGPAPEHRDDDGESREWGVPPFEPLSIRTADFEQAHDLDLPMSATVDPLDVTLNGGYAEHELVMAEEPYADEPASMEPADPPAIHDDAPCSTIAPAAPAAPASSAPNTSEMQRIVTVRVCALGDAHWRGADLLAALENHGLGYGRYKVFHRKHNDGRTLFCAASLVEPGTFDIARMPEEEYRGLTLFAVLPGPADALETLDTLIATAADLADTLQGAVQDATGAPLSSQRAEALREDVARFQESLS